MPTTTRERYLAVVRWGWPRLDLDAEHYRAKSFGTLNDAQAWAVEQTESQDALIKVYLESQDVDGEWIEVEVYYYDPVGGWDDE